MVRNVVATHCARQSEGESHSEIPRHELLRHGAACSDADIAVLGKDRRVVLMDVALALRAPLCDNVGWSCCVLPCPWLPLMAAAFCAGEGGN